MSAVLFNLIIDWMVRRTTEDQPRQIRWTLFDRVENFDFSDDLAQLSLSHQHMQEKTRCLSEFGQQVGMKINEGKKMEVISLNVNAPAPALPDDQAFPSTEAFVLRAALSNRMEVSTRTFRAD